MRTLCIFWKQRIVLRLSLGIKMHFLSFGLVRDKVLRLVSYKYRIAYCSGGFVTHLKAVSLPKYNGLPKSWAGNGSA